MGTTAGLDGVVGYYDAHPINEDQILRALEGRGLDLDRLTPDDLLQHDQDHYGGLAANDALIARAGLRAEHRVLDVCSGMGGPARYLAHRVGCRVVGLDLTLSRFESAQRLTRRVGLDGLVTFVHGNALEMPFSAGEFDAVIGQEAWCHVPDKPRLIAECARVLKPGGVIAFTDILASEALSAADAARLAAEMQFPVLGTMRGYQDQMQASGFEIVSVDDLGGEWTTILEERLAMYRSLGTETARKFGEGRSKDWDDYYSFFVWLFREGRLSGGRFVGRLRHDR